MLGQYPAALLASRACCTLVPFCTRAFGSRLPGRDQMLLAVTNQVRTSHLGQCFTQHGPVLRVVITQKGLVQAALAHRLDRPHCLTLVVDLTQRVLACVVHGGGGGHR